MGSGATEEGPWVPEWPPEGEPSDDQEYPRARNMSVVGNH